jgi:hypothetical protein
VTTQFLAELLRGERSSAQWGWYPLSGWTAVVTGSGATESASRYLMVKSGTTASSIAMLKLKTDEHAAGFQVSNGVGSAPAPHVRALTYAFTTFAWLFTFHLAAATANGVFRFWFGEGQTATTMRTFDAGFAWEIQNQDLVAKTGPGIIQQGQATWTSSSLATLTTNRVYRLMLVNEGWNSPGNPFPPAVAEHVPSNRSPYRPGEDRTSPHTDIYLDAGSGFALVGSNQGETVNLSGTSVFAAPYALTSSGLGCTPFFQVTNGADSANHQVVIHDIKYAVTQYDHYLRSL